MSEGKKIIVVIGASQGLSGPNARRQDGRRRRSCTWTAEEM
jgi:hypothetical protein